MTPSLRSMLLTLALVLALSLVTGCGQTLLRSRVEAETPAPSAALLSTQSATDWQTYSKKVDDYLSKVRESVTDLLSRLKGCNVTGPKSGQCL